MLIHNIVLHLCRYFFSGGHFRIFHDYFLSFLLKFKHVNILRCSFCSALQFSSPYLCTGCSQLTVNFFIALMSNIFFTLAYDLANPK